MKFIIVRTQDMKIHHDKEDYFLKLDKGVVLEEKKIVWRFLTAKAYILPIKSGLTVYNGKAS